MMTKFMTSALKSTLGAIVISVPMIAAADLSKVPSGAYANDNTHSYIQFQYNHLGLSNPRLGFDEFTVNMDLDTAAPENTSVDVSINVDSVITGSEIFHDHLTGQKWFDSANHGSISFISTGVTANADGTYEMVGDLTIREVTKPVTLTVTINNAMMHPMKKKPVVGVSAVGELNRSDWDLGANAPFISDNVTLSIEAEMIAAQ